MSGHRPGSKVGQLRPTTSRATSKSMIASRSSSRCSLLEKWPAALAIYLLAVLALEAPTRRLRKLLPPPAAPSIHLRPRPGALLDPAAADTTATGQCSAFLTEETDFRPRRTAWAGRQPEGLNVDPADDARSPGLVPMVHELKIVARDHGVDFSDPDYRTPARFAARRDLPVDHPLPERLEAKVAVVSGTAHEAYLKTLFTEVEARPIIVEDRPGALAAAALEEVGDVDLLFSDAITLAFWLNGTDSENCCSFRGGPFMDSRYFGEGVGIAVKQG